MTIDRDRVVKIPVWLVSFLLPSIIAVLGTYITWQVRAAELRQQVLINTQKWEHLPGELEKKVDASEYRADVRNLQESLKRIEQKLDAHIDK